MTGATTSNRSSGRRHEAAGGKADALPSHALMSRSRVIREQHWTMGESGHSIPYDLSVTTSGGAPCHNLVSSTTSGLAFRISSRPRSITTISCRSSGFASGSRLSPEDLSTMGLTAREARKCSSTKPKNPAPTHAFAQASITSRSWLRAEPSSERHTSGLVVAMP